MRIVMRAYDAISRLLDNSLRKEFPNKIFDKTYKRLDPYLMEKNPIKIVEQLLISCVSVMTQCAPIDFS